MRKCAICAVILAVAPGCALKPLWEPTRGEVIERILPSAVQVVIERDGQRFRSGSGVVIAARVSPQGTDCFVLTSGHALSRLSGQDRVFVLFGRQSGRGSKASATLLAHRDTKELDLSLLRAQTNQCAPVDFGPPPRLGDPILVAAYPWGRNLTLVGGIVSQVNRDHSDDSDTAPRLIVDASVSYGSSGGGMYDEHGRLVGLIEGYRTARVSFSGEVPQPYIDVPVPGETYVVPLADIRQFLIESNWKDLLGTLPTAHTPRE